MGKITRNLLLFLLIICGVLSLIFIIPFNYMVYVVAIGTTILYINTWLVSITNAVIEKKYESNYDLIYRIIFMFLMTISWSYIFFNI